MTDDDRTRVDELLDDILAAPDELAAVLDQHQRGISSLPDGLLDRPRWVLIGMGSSRFAALDAAATLRAAGREAVAEVASASGGSGAGPDTLAIVISNSGRTAETVAAAARHRHRSAVLALTAPDSSLAAEADAVLPLVAGRAETSGIATLSFLSTVAALGLLAGTAEPTLAGTGIAAAVPSLETLLQRRAAWVESTAAALDTGRPVHVLADGSRIGAAEQAALMLREAPRIDASAWDTGDWLHVGLYTCLPGDVVLLFTGSLADGEAIAVVHARGARVVAVGAKHPDADLHVPLPDGVAEDPVVRALVEPAVTDLLAASLWRRAAAETRAEGPAGE
jgi:glucosamine--fructose-6-phosphate aminotransferase (isomerizing)